MKLEGGQRILPQVEALVGAGIPVMGHLGLTPQSVNALGGYRVQGRGGSGERLLRDAKSLESAGAFAVVLEVVPADLARTRDRMRCRFRRSGSAPATACDAQVNVWQDLVGLTPAPHPKFIRPYADLRSVIADAVRAWSDDVVSGEYPSSDQSYQ